MSYKGEVPSGFEPQQRPTQPSRVKPLYQKIVDALNTPDAFGGLLGTGMILYGLAMGYVLSGRYEQSIQERAKATATLSSPASAAAVRPALVPITGFEKFI